MGEIIKDNKSNAITLKSY